MENDLKGIGMGLVDLEKLWFEKQPSIVTRLLRASMMPMEAAYKAGLSMAAEKKEALKVGCRVISVGNLTVGGNGKTPLVMELASILRRAGKRVAIVSRGYGRKSKGTRVVHFPGASMPDAGAAGDEPALMSIRCPYACVVVGQDRVDAAKLAVETWHPDVILCDDAFGHRRLHRDMDVLAIHAQRGFGNRRLLPAGPMREPAVALDRAGLVIFTYVRDETLDDLRKMFHVSQSIPAVCCRMKVSGMVDRNFELVEGSLPKRVIAASSIANPEGFSTSLKDLGLDVIHEVRWRDHHRPSSAQWKKLRKLMGSSGADAVLMTEKDLVRLPVERLDFALLGLRMNLVFGTESHGTTLERLLGF